MDSSQTLVLDQAGSPRRILPRASPHDGALLHGRYRLISRLGAGGFGVVWRAHDELLHRDVALKRIPLPAQALAAGRDGLSRAARASREALATARLAHPAIVALHEAYVDEDAFYLVSELIDGDTLARLIEQEELADVELLEIGVALTHALAHAHARGVIHRDVKPQNVLVPHDPDAHESPAKLTDFGGASLAGDEALTRTGETLGTLAYMAPEQCEGLDVDESADVYSLALVLYEGLAGVNPVRGPTPAATVRRIGRPLPPLASRRPDLSRSLSGALDTALAVDPTRRGTLEDLRIACELALRADLVQADPVQTDPSPALPQSPPAKPLAGSRHLQLPRALWLGCVIALAIWQAAAGRSGVALLLFTALAPLLLLGPRPGMGWLAAGLAPALGLVGLAGAYPALAGQAAQWSRRALLGALGYWWLMLAEPLLTGNAHGTRLWLGVPPSVPARAVWEGSLATTATHVIAPMLTIGLICGAVLWAVAAAVLPLLVRGSSALLDTLAAIAWSTALLAATPYFVAGLSVHGTAPEPRGAVLAAIAGAAVAVAGRALRGPVRAHHP